MLWFELMLMVVLVVASAAPLLAVGWLSTPQSERAAVRDLGPRAVWALIHRGSIVLAPRFPYTKY